MLLRSHRSRAASFCRAMLGSDEGAAAVMAEVARLRPRSRVELFRAVVVRCRGRRAQDRPGELCGILARIAALPEPQRAALLLREVGGLGHQQVACVLGTTVAEAQGMLVAARVSIASGELGPRRPSDRTIDSSVNWVESRAA